MRRLDSHLFTITYDLFPALVGLTGIEPVTSSLSGTRSNQLSYKPVAGFGRETEHSGVVCVMFQLRPIKGCSSERR